MLKISINYKKGFFCIILFIFLLSFTSFAGTLEFINDDFESHPLNTLSDEWQIKYPGQTAKVVDSLSQSADQSLFLNGNQSSAINIYQLIDTSAQNFDEIVVESSIYPNSVNESGSISLYNSSSNKYLARITLLNNKICYSTTGHDNNNLVELQDYTIGNWYHVQLIHDFNTRTYSIVINNTIVASDVAMYSDDPFDSIMLASGNSSEPNEIYFDDLKIYALVDEKAPIVTAGLSSRDSHSEGTVTFTSDEIGEYYLSVVEKKAAEPTIDTSGTGISCNTSEQIHHFTALTPGEKDVYIVVKDAAGNVSDPVKMTINLPVVKVSGTIATDTTWVNTNIYVIDDETTIQSTLTINPGTIIKFDGRHRLTVTGSLNALGIKDHEIYMTSINDDFIGGDTNGDGDASTASPGDWSAIDFGKNSNGLFNHTILNYGGGTWGG